MLSSKLKGTAWVLCAAIATSLIQSCDPPAVDLATTEYQKASDSVGCKPGSRSGHGGIHNDEETAKGTRFNVRTPLNYDGSVQHPLIMVYAPAGRNRFGNERMTNLTFAATRAGFIIAYADHLRMSGRNLIELSEIPNLVANKWCVDRARIYLTGHSDGGTVAMGLAFLEDTRDLAHAIAPSGVGIRGSDLAAYPCPEPISVLVMHSKHDDLFPGYGKESAEWWASCNQCASSPRKTNVAGCQEYPECQSNVITWYCEGKAPHAEWPALNSTIIDFFTKQSSLQRISGFDNSES